MKRVTGLGKRPLETQFDSGALITAAKFNVQGVLIIDYLLACCRVCILPEVKRETVDVGLLLGYPDAVALEQRVNAGSIVLLPVTARDEEVETVLTNLALEDTDRAVIQASRLSKRTRLVTDDHRLFITATRLKLHPLFLPDLILLLADSERITSDLAEELLTAMQPRYASGFVELSRKQLEGVI